MSYDGAGEPLGRSQVLAYLLGLAGDHRITLVSFEKDGADIDAIRAELKLAGIEWVPLRYHRRPPVLGTALDVARGRRALARIARSGRPDVVHVRSDVPALMAHLARRRTGAPMLFDIRGFWADERVEGGLWPRGGVLYRLARRCERRFYADAATVVTQTEASVPAIRAQVAGAPVEIIPNCVDHALYAGTTQRSGGPHAVWSGSIGTWYRFDLAPRLAAALELPLTVLTRQIDEARAALGDVPADVRTVAPAEMPAELHEGDIGLCLILSSPSKRASAPTRFAEYLAAGMPVAVTPGVGDLDALVAEHDVGVVLRGEDDAALREAASRLRALAADPETRERCRRLAAERFDLARGTARYADLYRRLAPTAVAEDGERVLAQCPLCGSPQIAPLHGYERAHLQRCGACGFVFAGRRPSVEQMRRQYAGYGLADVESPLTRRRYEELLDEFEAYRRTGRILDVGCGEGGFLEAAARRGWEVHGTESTAGALERNRARGIAMTLAPARPGDLPAAAFDVVTAFEVVEHVGDPRPEAAAIADAIRDGGLLYVTTPNFSSASRRMLGAGWNVIEYPEHLGYFTAGTLSRWLCEAGFDPLAVTTTGISPGRLLGGLRRRPGAVPPAPRAGTAALDERVRERVEGAAALRATKLAANAALSALGAGDTLKGRFVRRAREVR